MVHMDAVRIRAKRLASTAEKSVGCLVSYLSQHPETSRDDDITEALATIAKILRPFDGVTDVAPLLNTWERVNIYVPALHAWFDATVIASHIREHNSSLTNISRARIMKAVAALQQTLK